MQEWRLEIRLGPKHFVCSVVSSIVMHTTYRLRLLSLQVGFGSDGKISVLELDLYNNGGNMLESSPAV